MPASEVHNIDCLELMRTLPDNCFQLAIADPPYGIGEDGAKNHSRSSRAKATEYTPKDWDKSAPGKEFFAELCRVSKYQIIWGANHFIENLPTQNASCWVVWDKENGENDFADCELAWTNFPSAVRRFKFRWAGMLQGNMANKESRIHPTQKPVALYAWLLQHYAKPGDRIFDPMMGSQSRAALPPIRWALTMWAASLTRSISPKGVSVSTANVTASPSPTTANATNKQTYLTTTKHGKEMRKMNLGQHKVVMYDSIEELPIVRFQKYNKMLMLDAGLGSDLTAFDAKLARVSEYIKANDLANASAEIDNLRQTLFNVQNGLTPHFMSLIPLMAEVDGEPLTDLSDENIQAVYDRLKDVTMKAYEGAASEVKKKIEEELKAYFNQGGESASSKEYYELMRRRALLMLEEIEKGNDHSEEIREIESQMVRHDKPRIFQGVRNAEVLYDKNFVGCCIAIAQNLNMDARKMTVLEYYRAIEVLEEQQKQLEKK